MPRAESLPGAAVPVPGTEPRGEAPLGLEVRAATADVQQTPPVAASDGEMSREVATACKKKGVGGGGGAPTAMSSRSPTSSTNPLRKGKWTPEEEAFTESIITDFSKG